MLHAWLNDSNDTRFHKYFTVYALTDKEDMPIMVK
jgi:hypothetical protein